LTRGVQQLSKKAPETFMKNIVSILFLTAILLCSCQKRNETKEDTATSLSFQAERNTFFSNLKTPAEVAAKLQAASAEFNSDIMSDPKEFTAYATNPTKAAANLGIYLSDLNYAIAYQQGSQTKELFQAAHELSKVIGLEKGILDFLMKRYRDNLAQNDSVKAVVNLLFEKSTMGLQGTDRERLVGIAMASYQIENLHLVLGVIERLPPDIAPDNERAKVLAPLYQLIADQKSNIEITYGFLKSITDITDPDKNPNYPFYGNAIKELIDVYNRLSISPQSVVPLNNEAIQELDEKVSVIRNKIVSIE
jgi:hypothetical protein